MRMFSMITLIVAALMGGCTVLPGPEVYPPQAMYGYGGSKLYPHYPYGQGLHKDVRIKIRENEQGLVSFTVSEQGLSTGEVEWILSTVDELKGRCPSGGMMKRYEITSSERFAPNTRRVRGDISVAIEYHCNRNNQGNTRRNMGDWS